MSLRRYRASIHIVSLALFRYCVGKQPRNAAGFRAARALGEEGMSETCGRTKSRALGFLVNIHL